jgi:hypothetical protein
MECFAQTSKGRLGPACGAITFAAFLRMHIAIGELKYRNN